MGYTAQKGKKCALRIQASNRQGSLIFAQTPAAAGVKHERPVPLRSKLTALAKHF